MITIQQIKAARSLLDWTQSDLAKASGISMPAIAKIEQGGNPREQTLKAIRGAFEKNDIEFLGSHGVDKKHERFSIKTFSGHEGVFKIWADIEHTLPQGGDVLLSNLDDHFWEANYKKELQLAIGRRDKLNIHFRALLNEDDTFVFIDRPLQYRLIPKELFTQMPYYIYGNKVCFMLVKQKPFRWILIESAPLSEAFRMQFEYNWSIGKTL